MTFSSYSRGGRQNAALLLTLFTMTLSQTAVRARSVAASPALTVNVKRAPQQLHIETKRLSLEYHLDTGLWEAHWPDTKDGKGASLSGASCAAKLADGTDLQASAYTQHESLATDTTPIADAFGKGVRIVIHHRAPGRPELRQSFTIYRDLPFFFTRLEVVGTATAPIATNDISVITLDETKTPGSGLTVAGSSGKPRTLYVPYDNDRWVRYNSDWSTSSYEVTAIYDDSVRNGVVLGSVTHDLWKTGISMGGLATQRVGSLRVYAGAAGDGTQDTQPHGIVTAPTVASPLVFVGFYPDWRNGMEAYGRACAHFHPALAWSGGVPFGWNSWAAYKEKVDEAHYRGVSDFMKAHLQGEGFENKGPVYVNFDSFWDNLSEERLQAVVKYVHANGQKAGIYWTPFVYWGDNRSQTVEGTNGRYTYGDIMLKDASGKPLPKVDGGWPLDPTHPGTLQRIDWEMQRFVRWGYEYVKLDFLTHGALEGAHFDPKITTGTAAYNLGMKRVVDAVDPKKIGHPFFISLSIAPLFPAGYGHSRRISCDAFGAIQNTEYMLNSLTYGWWMNRTVYEYNDPDHTVLYQEHGQSPTTENEGRSRLNASVIAGTVLMDSDDLTEPGAQARAEKLLGNREVMALARSGISFRPVNGDTGAKAADFFVRSGSGKTAAYVAVFNYDGKAKATRQISLARLGLNPNAEYHIRDLWSGQTRTVKGDFSIDLDPAESTILQISRS